MRLVLWCIIDAAVILCLAGCRRQQDPGPVQPAPGSPAAAAVAADVNLLTCRIAGIERDFSRNAKVVVDAKTGLHVTGFSDTNDAEFISLGVPDPKVARRTLADTPGLSLRYSRDMTSSDMGNSYRAASSEPGASLEVTVTRMGGPGERVEGSFSATARSGPGISVLEKMEGVFSIKRTRPRRN